MKTKVFGDSYISLLNRQSPQRPNESHCFGSINIASRKEATMSDYASLKRSSRFRWSDELHVLFLEALHKLGPTAFPSQILKEMYAASEEVAASGLTREQVASHLQKFRTDHPVDTPKFVFKDETSRVKDKIKKKKKAMSSPRIPQANPQAYPSTYLPAYPPTYPAYPHHNASTTDSSMATAQVLTSIPSTIPIVAPSPSTLQLVTPPLQPEFDFRQALNYSPFINFHSQEFAFAFEGLVGRLITIEQNAQWGTPDITRLTTDNNTTQASTSGQLGVAAHLGGHNDT